MAYIDQQMEHADRIDYRAGCLHPIGYGGGWSFHQICQITVKVFFVLLMRAGQNCSTCCWQKRLQTETFQIKNKSSAHTFNHASKGAPELNITLVMLKTCDSDIVVTILSKLASIPMTHEVLISFGIGRDHRTIIDLMHAFWGSDATSVIAGIGKKTTWKRGIHRLTFHSSASSMTGTGNVGMSRKCFAFSETTTFTLN
ncbi:hypothetical protein MAR_025020 [Mya arenaria]|uniref:Uncharacterized protein n=1 Tax=Mya arenaria TaxID=6604 RepID=A0ABY7DSG8_MYAAR|nr:hypothetical protein MAR_025020 [Mya arenaria]